MTTTLYSLLKTFDCIALKRTDKDTYLIISTSMDWIDYIFTRKPGQLVVHEEDACLFLRDFLIDAEAFWSKEKEGSVRSGIWTEEYSFDSRSIEKPSFGGHSSKLQQRKNTDY